MKTIQITLQAPQPLSLPLAYHHHAQSLLYQWLEYDPELSIHFHNRGYSSGNRFYKLFTFGPFQGSYAIQDKQIVFDNILHWEIRAANPLLIDTIFSAISENPSQKLHGQPVQITAATVSQRRNLYPVITIQMLSPLTIHTTGSDGKTVYYTPSDENFATMCSANARRKYEAFYQAEPGAALGIHPLCEKVPNKYVTRFKGTYITAYGGRYQLSCCNPALLEFLYYTGIGDRNSQGFGMFKIL